MCHVDIMKMKKKKRLDKNNETRKATRSQQARDETIIQVFFYPGHYQLEQLG
jgi:hypothetical protein